MPRNAGCEACELCVHAYNRCVWGRQIGGEAPIMVVGEAPGPMEDREGRVFVGQASKFFLGALAGARINNYYATVAVKCRPQQNKLPDTKKRLKAIFDGCLGYLREEIEAVKPKFILALGNAPLQALTGLTGITKHRGTVVPVDFGYGEVVVFPAYHPSYVLRNPGLEKMFKLDLGTFAGLVQGRTGEDFWKPMNNVVVTSGKQLKQMLDQHELAAGRDNTVMVYDIETLSYDPEKVSALDCPPELGTIPWMGIGYHSESGENVQYIIPWEHPKAGDSWRHKLNRVLKCVLEDKRYKRAAHYGKSDDRWLYSRGIYPWRTYDTYNAAFMLDENIPHGLETVSKLEVGAPVWGVGFDYSALGTMPFVEVADYLGKDLYSVGRVYFVQRKKIAADQGLARVFKHIMMPGDRMICEIEQQGIWVFEDKLAEKTEKFKGKRMDSLKELAKAYEDATGKKLENYGITKGDSNIWNSTPQKQRILFEELGLQVIKRSKKTGLPSTDKDVLARLDEDTGHPVVKALRKYQTIEMLCRFLKRWAAKLELSKKVRGEPRLYTVLNIAKVVTGRLSSEDPDGTGDNLQQVPSRGEGSELKECFGVPPGRKLIEADYSQIELVTASFVAPEENMKNLFRTGKDMHYATAGAVRFPKLVKTHAHIFGEAHITLPDGRTIEITKEDRKKAKPVNFGFLYEMQDKKFVNYALTNYGESYTLAEAKRFREAYFTMYPGLINYYQETKAELRSTGQVRTIIGRIRRLPDIYSPDEYVQMEAERQAINTKVQSPANDFTLTAAIHLHNEFKRLGWDAKLILLVHDSIMIDCAEEIAEQVAALTKKTMEKIVPVLVRKRYGVNLDVPLRCEVNIGSAWGQGTVWEGEIPE